MYPITINLNNQRLKLPALIRTSTVYLVVCLLTILSPSPIKAQPTLGHPKAIHPKIKASTQSQNKEAQDNSQSKKVNTLEENTASIKPSDHTDILYELMVASIASARGNKDEALENAVEAAKKSQDPAIAAYSTEIAVNFQAAQPALESAVIWANNAKNDLQAQMVAATLLIGQSIEKAQPYLKRAIELDPQEMNQHIITIQSKLSNRSAEHLKMALQQIAKEDENNPYKQIIAAQSTAQQGEIAQANALIDHALKLNPGLTSAIQLKARLIRHEDNSDSRALQYLSDKVTKFPMNSELRVFLASALMDANRLNDAANHLNKLTDDKVYGGQALLFLGEIHFAANQPQKSKNYLLKAFEHSEVQDNAAYDLGELAEIEKRPEEAIQWYAEVKPGTFHIPATIRAVTLLKQNKSWSLAINLLHDASPTTIDEQKLLLLTEVDILAESKQLEDASNLINEILGKLPEDIDVIFSHGLVAIKMKNYTTAESDFKNILKINASYGDALNALGYLLTLQNDRLPEAKQYLNEAVSLSPKNPVYLANLGWVEYKIGDKQKALEYLKQAYSIKENTEIAAYLGEVLWSTGNKQEAIKVLSSAYQVAPENNVLQETLERLKIEKSELKPKEATKGH